MRMRNNQFNKEYEEPINKDLGYPYNILPRGYPDKISDTKIKDTVQLLLSNLRPNAGVQSIVDLHTTLINLGAALLVVQSEMPGEAVLKM